MMAAVADFAESKGEPPPVLTLALDCEYYHALPHRGGVLDQPAGLLRRMRTATNVYRAFIEYNREGRQAGKMAKWRNENSGIWEIVADVNRMRNG